MNGQERALLEAIIPYNHKEVGKETLGALARQRTIPTERPPLVGKISANFSG
jgi:hypothetical protein